MISCSGWNKGNRRKDEMVWETRPTTTFRARARAHCFIHRAQSPTRLFDWNPGRFRSISPRHTINRAESCFRSVIPNLVRRINRFISPPPFCRSTSDLPLPNRATERFFFRGSTVIQRELYNEGRVKKSKVTRITCTN